MEPLICRAKVLQRGIAERVYHRSLPIDPCFRDYKLILSWLQSTPNCPCCGELFEMFPNGRTKAHQHSPSIDRFRPDLGYVVGNVALICWRCNNIKRDYEASDLQMVARWMLAFDKKK